MGAFSGMKDATRGFTSNPLRPGRYVVRIDECASFEADRKGRMWKNTLTILKVEDGDHKVGEVVHTFWKKGEYPEVFFGNIIGFIAGVLNVDDSEVNEAETEMVLSDENPLAGLVTTVTGVQRQSKNGKDDNGNPYTYTKYSFSPSFTDEEIEEAIGADGVARFFPSE